MRTLYLDLGMGAAGDMLTAALLELLDADEQTRFVDELNGLGLDGVAVSREAVTRCGIAGTHMHVMVDGIEEGDEAHAHAQHGYLHHHGAHSDDDRSECGHHGHDHAHEYGHHRRDSNQHGHHAQDHGDHFVDGGHECPHGHGYDHGHECEGHDHAHHHHGQEHGHRHADMHAISHIVNDHLSLPERVRSDVLDVYQLIADAEARAHGMDVSAIHFHEVGMKDAIMDVAAVCLLVDRIAPERIVASPVHVGSGTVRCMHGVMPVPAPATAFLLEGLPMYGGAVQGELCTPTGAALVRHFVSDFGPMPMMRVERIGYGMGTREFEQANCLRAMLGETEGSTDAMLELSCNVDDMTAEEAAFACEELLAVGAAEAYTVAIGMKKGRPGLLVRAICKPKLRDAVVRALFANTTTIGVREVETRRFVLDRSEREVTTDFGTLHLKESSGYGVRRGKYEYDDLAHVAHEQGMPLLELKRALPRP